MRSQLAILHGIVSSTHDLFRGRAASLPASPRICIPCSRYRLHVMSIEIFYPLNTRLTRNVVLLPRQHDLWCPVVSRRDIASHLRILNTCQSEVADLLLSELKTSHHFSGKLTLRSQFSLTRMFEGFRSRCTTPAEWTYLSPRRIW